MQVEEIPLAKWLIKSIDQLSGSTENTVNMVMAMMKGAQVGQNAELPQSERIPPQEIDEAMKEIKPQINESDSVALLIRQEVSSIAGAQLPNSTDLITNKREIETTVLADNGEILVLGGLISEEIQESVNKVPILGDIPLIGRLFQSSATSVQRRNLMIFLRPTILRDSITTKDLSEEKYNLIKAKQILNEEDQKSD